MDTWTIARLGHHGDGIAEGPVFVPRALPGEVVSGTQVEDRLTDVRIVTPSSDRVAPPCRHYKACGGCHLQHATDSFVADWKVDVMVQALAARGLDTDMRGILTSPPRSRRRASFSARRTKKAALAGFHGRASNTIVELQDCLLLHPDLQPAPEIAGKLATLGGSRKGEMSVAVTQSAAGLDVSVTGGKPADGPLLLQLAAACEDLGLARLAWDGETVAMRQPPVQQFGRAQVVPPVGAFLQATPQGEAALLDAVKEIVGHGGGKGIDLFAGCGTFTLPLSELAEMHAVEGDAAMVQALEAGWRKAGGLKKVTVEARDLFRNPVLPEELRFDFAVIDPPRAGAEAQVMELAASKIGVVAFVSCNPVTFARDAAVLVSAGFVLEWVQVVDQFRWSPHIELVASFRR